MMKLLTNAALLSVAFGMDTSSDPGPDLTVVQATKTYHKVATVKNLCCEKKDKLGLGLTVYKQTPNLF